jgi:methyl-accepting chemotaxis protein
VIRPAVQIRGLALEASMVSFGWFIFLSMAGSQAPPDELALIATVMAGVMAVGALRYSALPAASLAFLGTAVAVCMVYSALSAIPTAVFLFLAVFVLLLGRSVLAQAQMFTHQFEAGAALAKAASERELLWANAEQEKWRSEASTAQANVQVQEERERIRREAIGGIAGHFETGVLATINELAAAAAQARTAAATLTLTTGNAHQEVASVAARAGEADTGAASLLQACDELAHSASGVKRRLADQEGVTQEVQAMSREADQRFAALVACAVDVRGVIDTIAGIASRTDILALNANIEAARAGDAGRGFSVVATEVKALAAQTMTATDEVRRHLNAISGAVASTESIVREMRGSFDSVHEISQAVDQAIAAQDAVIQMIQQYAGVAASLTTELQGSAANAERAADDASGLTNALGQTTDALVEQAQALTRDTAEFLSSLKAA